MSIKVAQKLFHKKNEIWVENKITSVAILYILGP